MLQLKTTLIWIENMPALTWHQNGVNDVYDPIGLHDVGNRDGGFPAFCILYPQLACVQPDRQRLTRTVLSITFPPCMLASSISCLAVWVPDTTW